VTTHVRIGGGVVLTTIKAEDSRICQECGKFAETRPYGKDGIRVCFSCAMKDEAEAGRQFLGRMEGKS
jgi:formylmethanofuran dehydrogenase subunit E